MPNDGDFWLQCDAVRHSYAQRGYDDPIEALRNISFSTKSKRITAIVGMSGCGKSTLLKIVAGLLKPLTGSVEAYKNRLVLEADQLRVGMVFQDPALLEWRTVLDNVVLPRELSGHRNHESVEPLHQLLELVDMSSSRNSDPQELSGGMKSRVAIARALAADPLLLLLDEPFGSLDEVTSKALCGQVRKLCYTANISALMVTHSIWQAVLTADQVLVMSPRPGRILEKIEIEKVSDHSGTLVDERMYNSLIHHVRDSLETSIGNSLENKDC